MIPGGGESVALQKLFAVVTGAADGPIRIGMADDHLHDIDQDDVRATLARLLNRGAPGAVAGDVLGLPERLPAALRNLSEEAELPDPDVTPEQRRAIRERNTRRRDRAERASRQAKASPPRTLGDTDVALESMARDNVSEGETMEMAFACLMTSSDPKFQDLLKERERVAVGGAGTE